MPTPERLSLRPLRLVVCSFALILVTYQQAAAQAEDVANATASTDDILELDCYEENLTRMIHLEVNITKQSVIEPKDFGWGGIGRPKRPDQNSGLYLGATGTDGHPLSITIFRLSRAMHICELGYPAGTCEFFTCYKPSVPLF